MNGRSGAGELRERLRDRAIQRIVQIVVADPIFEEIAEHIKRFCISGRPGNEIEELLEDARTLGREVKIRNEEGVGQTPFFSRCEGCIRDGLRAGPTAQRKFRF